MSTKGVKVYYLSSTITRFDLGANLSSKQEEQDVTEKDRSLTAYRKYPHSYQLSSRFPISRASFGKHRHKLERLCPQLLPRFSPHLINLRCTCTFLSRRSCHSTLASSSSIKDDLQIPIAARLAVWNLAQSLMSCNALRGLFAWMTHDFSLDTFFDELVFGFASTFIVLANPVETHLCEVGVFGRCKQ